MDCRMHQQVEAEEGITEVEEGKEKTEAKPAAACSDFFLMMRNKSIVPPNRGIKTYPQGSKGRVIDIDQTWNYDAEQRGTGIIMKGGVAIEKLVRIGWPTELDDIHTKRGCSFSCGCKSSQFVLLLWSMWYARLSQGLRVYHQRRARFHGPVRRTVIHLYIHSHVCYPSFPRSI